MDKKTYFITGGAGFIGSHLSELLLKNGHRVLALDNFSTGSEKNIEGLIDNENYHFVRASLDDDIVVDRMASESDIIIHLAAAVGVMLIVERPVHTIRTNIMGTEKILDAALRYNSRVLLASTSEVYGKGVSIPFAEEDDVLLGASSKNRWAYAATKMVDEFLGLAYHQEYGLEVVPFRLFNTVGARQTGQYGMVVPRFVQQAMNNEDITVFGTGDQSRCFCDVRDIIRALYDLSLHADSPGQVFNIGSQNEISITGLAEKVIEITGSSSGIKYIPYDEAYAPGFEDMERRVPDLSRINKLIGWESEYSIDDILNSVHDSLK
ncbi:MAG: GDP-mannose 4,6-dehydratase [Lentisphaeria bacterium]|nr:GDP-mannose 4,6-dehydratase [Lentisphaeria bacterium]NQZ69230.1 GDP-mannose 4,6-dehydratase [Lentisphaeria bacterium]